MEDSNPGGLGLLKHVGVVFRKIFGVSYSDFYEQLIRHFETESTTAIGAEINLVKRIVAEAFDGGRLDLALSEFGEICWPLEEVSFLNLMKDKVGFYAEVRSFIGILALKLGNPMDSALLDDLVLYQSSLMKDPETAEFSVAFQYDLHGYFEGTTKTLDRSSKRLLVRAGKGFEGDLEVYAREVVWYGRKGGQFHHLAVEI